MNRDRIAALLFLAISLGYGWMSTGIEMFSGSEDDVFTPRTLPYVLAGAGVVLSLLMLVLVPADRRHLGFASAFQGLIWGRVFQLAVAMLVYGWLIEELGFVLSTALFLAAGCWILGERKPKTMLLVSLLLSVGFWFVLTQLLDIYLSPGELFLMLGGE